MIEIIQSKNDSCTGCNRCVRECPMETANITFLDEKGNIKVKIDHNKCITCGRCVTACKHNARHYTDDTERFFEDLKRGVPISLIVAPSVCTNIPGYKKLFTYLKQLGVNKIYDVSLGADICIWAHIRYIQKNGVSPMITQPCPAIVTYCEMYHHDLLKRLSPVQSPMACVAIYMKKYRDIPDRIAALSPCAAKANEFESTALSQYNVTFFKMNEYLEKNNIELPNEETEFDHDESGLGSLFPMPGGLKENIEYFMGKKLHVARAEGFEVYEKLNKYAETPEDFLPEIFDVLNCIEGCNIGSACSHDRNVFEIDKTMNANRKRMTAERKKEYYDMVYKTYDATFVLSHFIREYQPVSVSFPEITNADISKAFELLGKTDYEKQNVDCGACGSETCHNMARKIVLGVNIPLNCIVKSKEDAKKEHENNMLAHEQLTAMEKMHEADERIRVILDASPMINILLDNRFKVIDCNSAACDFMGVTSKDDFFTIFMDYVIKSIPQFQPDGHQSIPIAERLVTAAKEGYTKFETELNIGGVMRFLDVEMKRIPYENSFAIIVYVFDMTEIREREKELIHTREQNELQLAKLNLVVKATKIGLWNMEVMGNDPVNPVNSIMWSDEFRQLLGFKDESDFPNLISSFNERLHPEDFEKVKEAIESHLMDVTGKTPYDIEYRAKKKSGEYAYYHASGETIRDENGNPIRIAGSLMDVTEVKNLIFEAEGQRKAAEEANKAKSAFLSTMSHEIRTPMNAVLGITEIQLQNDMLEKNAKEAFQRIYNSGDLLLGIINDILDLSKIEAGKLEFSISEYQTASLISDSVQLNMMRLGSKPIKFELHIDENLPVSLSGDELRVKQILNNLLSNAFKYTAVGTVKLSISLEADKCNDNEVMLLITVSDTGQGMTKEQIDKLFDEYSRFNQDANRTTEGTGLGMSITRNLLRLMKGEISVESEPGKGSVFTVHLPQRKINSAVLGREMTENLHQFRTRSRAQMKRVQITREPMPYGSVLIVDDVETNIYVAKGLLAPYGLKIDSSDSGFSAIEKIKNGKTYDIIFMDHMMPKMDGIEATKILRSMGYKHAIVALTANAVSGQADIFLGNGFSDFISKPIDVRQLNFVLNKLIRDKQPPDVLEAARQQAEAKKEQSADIVPQPEISPRFAEIFARDAKKSLAVLAEIIGKGGPSDDNDMNKYIIHVHGMKGALANLRKMDLSAVALKLEQSAREGNIGYIKSETSVFLNLLQNFVDEITSNKNKAAAPESSPNQDAPLHADNTYLKELLLVIKTACEENDKNTADLLIAELKTKTWQQPAKELLDTIAEYLPHNDFSKIVDAIHKFSV